ncbi:MAG: type I DNA topoisomerase [Bacteroidetes bacterium]|nr:MAG: type I DNA topoisomerase [Bacteroidota bacterium]TAG89788.1 MAG: type I DNA topoisomerase [Bacteroidota bacterium]
MGKNLVIVESPAKAKTIEGYLGKDFTVKSSYGHVRDLPKNNDAIDVANNFTPHYEVSADKKQIVSELKKLSKEAETIWLATDDDREGEAISWHLKESLELKKGKDIKRIVFREITKAAILKAIENPRDIDYDLVNAQQARRILDRLVGFEISPVLWKKVKPGLSAGRVQSVAVRLIVEREREILKFNSVSSYKIVADFDLEKGKKLNAELPKNIEDNKGAEVFLQKCIKAEFKIKDIETKPAKQSPSAPFTTSTLQQEASRKLGFSVSKTMVVAQKLYEAGKISYMRTDSTNLSEDAIAAASAQIKNEYGKEYIQNRRYKTKSASAQEAHEAIRPTDFAVSKTTGERDEQRLYELIWKRAIASQMADAQLERTTATIGIKTINNDKMPDLLAKGEVIKFEGFLKVYLESNDEDEDEENAKMLPPLKIGQVLDLNQMKATEKFTRPSARYTEASLVKELEEQGIGRPSTYAPTISTIQQRGYVVKEDREGKQRNFQEFILKNNEISQKTGIENYGAEKSKLFPTDLAGVVNDFLKENFDNIVDYSFTADVEKEFDDIAEGKKNWVQVLKVFYDDFHSKVENTSQNTDRASVNKSRALGKHPDTKEDIVVALGRYGAFVQIGEASEDKAIKPKRASLKKGQSMESITLEEALELFKLPRETGTFEGKTMLVSLGKFGPYIRHEDKFYSLNKEDDPYTIDEAKCVEIIETKRKNDAEKLIKSFVENPKVQILNGRWGAYIKFDTQNVKIPKDKDPKELTYKECVDLAKESEAKPKPKSTFTTKKKK